MLFQKMFKGTRNVCKKMANFENDLNNTRLLFFNNKIKEHQFRKQMLTIKQK